MRENTWLLPLIGAVLGLGLAQIVGTESTTDTDWTVTVDRSRDTLFGILGLMFTAVSITLALASVAAQNVVGRFGSRTLRIYLRRSPEQWVLGSFTLSASFVMFEQFELRKLPSDGPAPTTSLLLSVILLVVTASLLVAYIAVIVRWFRVDKAAIAMRRSSLEAARARVRASRIGSPRVSVPPRPNAAIDVPAPRSGHLADVDTEALLDVCQRLDAVAVIDEPLGAAVIEGQPIGWIAGRKTGIESVPERELADTIDVSETREVAGSIEYGLIGMVDIAIIALSPAVNNPNTAVEVIEEMSFLFARLPHGDLGPYALGEADGCRAIVFARTFGALVEVGTTQIVLYGISDPLVRRALERLARSLRLLDLDDDDRAHVDRFVAKIRN